MTGGGFKLGIRVAAHADRLAFLLCLLCKKFRDKPEIIAQRIRAFFEEMDQALEGRDEDRRVVARVLHASINGILESLARAQEYKTDRCFDRETSVNLEGPIRVHAQELVRLYLWERRRYLRQLNQRRPPDSDEVTSMSEDAIRERFDAYFWQVQRGILRRGGDVYMMADLALAALDVVMDQMEDSLHGADSNGTAETTELPAHPGAVEGLGLEEPEI